MSDSLFDSIFGKAFEQRELDEIKKRAVTLRGALADIQRELAEIETAPIAAAGCNSAAAAIRRCRALASTGLRA